MSPSPNIRHQAIIGRIHLLLLQFLEKKTWGEVFVAPLDVFLSEINVYQPDIIFVSNQRRKAKAVECVFRVSGKQPELWHPDTGVIELAPVWSEHEGCTSVPMRFDPAAIVPLLRCPPSAYAPAGIRHRFQPRRGISAAGAAANGSNSSYGAGGMVGRPSWCRG